MLVLASMFSVLLGSQSTSVAPSDTLAVTNVSVLPMDSSEILDNRTVGQRANLILVNDNPLKNLHALRDPAGLILGGQWISGTDLRKMRKQ